MAIVTTLSPLAS